MDHLMESLEPTPIKEHIVPMPVQTPSEGTFHWISNIEIHKKKPQLLAPWTGKGSSIYCYSTAKQSLVIMLDDALDRRYHSIVLTKPWIFFLILIRCPMLLWTCPNRRSEAIRPHAFRCRIPAGHYSVWSTSLSITAFSFGSTTRQPKKTSLCFRCARVAKCDCPSLHRDIVGPNCYNSPGLYIECCWG